MTPECPNACPSSRELLHVAMAEILKQPNWWALPEGQATGIGYKAVRAGIPPQIITEEFRALRCARGLPALRTD